MSETTKPMYEFFGRATGSDPEGYYHQRWDRAQPITVNAETTDEANRKAFQVLGPHPRFGRSGFGDERDASGWALIWDEIVAVKEAPGAAALAAVVKALNHIESQVTRPAGTYEAGVFDGEQAAARFIRNTIEMARGGGQ